VRAGWLGLVLLLAGCAAGGGWTKTGADSAAASHEYEDCRAVAETAVKTDADIDQDIRATRRSDWQRAAGVRAETQAMQEHTSGRATAIIAACMHAKGFAEPR
jgi:hypothetical protein